MWLHNQAFLQWLTMLSNRVSCHAVVLIVVLDTMSCVTIAQGSDSDIWGGRALAVCGATLGKIGKSTS